jgi:hypothetical protein
LPISDKGWVLVNIRSLKYIFGQNNKKRATGGMSLCGLFLLLAYLILLLLVADYWDMFLLKSLLHEYPMEEKNQSFHCFMKAKNVRTLPNHRQASLQELLLHAKEAFKGQILTF